jgi:hypothetical protein
MNNTTALYLLKQLNSSVSPRELSREDLDNAIATRADD